MISRIFLTAAVLAASTSLGLAQSAPADDSGASAMPPPPIVSPNPTSDAVPDGFLRMQNHPRSRNGMKGSRYGHDMRGKPGKYHRMKGHDHDHDHDHGHGGPKGPMAKGFELEIGPGQSLRVMCGDEPMKGCVEAVSTLIDRVSASPGMMPPPDVAPPMSPDDSAAPASPDPMAKPTPPDPTATPTEIDPPAPSE